MIGFGRFLTVIIPLVVVGLYINLRADINVPMNRPLRDFPTQQGSWLMQSQSAFSENVLSVLKPTDYLSRYYGLPDGTKAGLYIGYHDGGKESGRIHSPKNCLPGSGWFLHSSKKMTLDIGGAPLHLVKAVYQKGEDKELFLYWFQVMNGSVNDEFALKAAEITGSLLHRRRESSFVRISIPFRSDEEKALAQGISFLRDMYPTIVAFLPGKELK